VLNVRTLRTLRTLKPLDLLRRRLTSCLEIDADQAVSRGDEVEARVTISDAAKAGSVEVGVVCTEYYDEDVTDTYTDSDGVMQTQTTRETLKAAAHEEWRSIESTVGLQTVRFTIPAGAPFSYEGDCLSFRWEVVARGRRHDRLDAQAGQAISVRP
jgi:hypothetical protein